MKRYIDNDSLEDYNILRFTNLSDIDISDEDVNDYELVCGIKIETNYMGNPRIEQLTIFDIGIGGIFDLDGNAEIVDINENEVTLRINDTIDFKDAERVNYCNEDNKKEVTIKVNANNIGGLCNKTIPSMILYKLKILYVRKSRKINNHIK